MKFEIDFSKKIQRQNYIFNLERILSNCYQDARHIVLPYKTQNYWYIPDYELMNDPQFIAELQKYHEQEYFLFDNGYLDLKVSEVFDEYVQVSEIKPDLEKIRKIETEINKFITCVFSDISDVTKIVIIPTQVGTIGNFCYNLDKSGKVILYCSYLIGKIEHLPTTIFAAFIQHFAKFGPNLNHFIDRQVVMSFFQNFTRLGEILPKPNSKETLEIMNDDKSQYIEDSANYLAKMGFPVKACFSYDKNNIYFNSKALLDLQQKEIEILKLLIDKKSIVVSFDEIAQTYWKDAWQEKFSLSAIAKIIEKIRKSLLRNEIKFEVIGTVRKRGYILYD